MNNIKLWIDDERNEPDGWLRVSDAVSAITALRMYYSNISHIFRLRHWNSWQRRECCQVLEFDV